MNIPKSTAAAALWLLMPVAAIGQTPPNAFSPAVTGPIGEEIVAVRARRIETVSKGVIDDGIIVIRNGKISAVGKDVKIPVGARVILGDTVMPGIVGGYSRIGLSSPAGGGGAPVVFAGGGRFGGGGGARGVANAHHRVNDELYPFNSDYERLLRAGVTTLGLMPGGTGINGQGAAVRTLGDSAEKMALASTGPLAINFGTDTATQELIRNTLNGARLGPSGAAGGRPGALQPDDAEEFESLEESGSTAGADAAQRGQRRTFQRPTGGGFTPPSSLTLMARRIPVARAVAGETPTYVNCSDAAEVVYARQLLTPFDRLKAVYVLTSDSYRVVDLLGGSKASVIIPADLTFEPNTRNRVNPAAILTSAGVKIACRPPTDNPEGYEGLRFKMAELIRGGLDRETALKAITLHPAEMLGVSDRAGSIEIGRDANLILLDGDPFAALTRVRRVMLEGKDAYVDR